MPRQCRITPYTIAHPLEFSPDGWPIVSANHDQTPECLLPTSIFTEWVERGVSELRGTPTIIRSLEEVRQAGVTKEMQSVMDEVLENERTRDYKVDKYRNRLRQPGLTPMKRSEYQRKLRIYDTNAHAHDADDCVVVKEVTAMQREAAARDAAVDLGGADPTSTGVWGDDEDIEIEFTGGGIKYMIDSAFTVNRIEKNPSGVRSYINVGMWNVESIDTEFNIKDILWDGTPVRRVDIPVQQAVKKVLKDNNIKNRTELNDWRRSVGCDNAPGGFHDQIREISMTHWEKLKAPNSCCTHAYEMILPGYKRFDKYTARGAVGLRLVW